MTKRTGKFAYVKSYYQFKMRDIEISAPKPGWMTVDIKCCGVCGTDLFVAERTAQDWQSFGHEMSGVVLEVGEGVTQFQPGDRVALDSSVPCGECKYCKPIPYGRGRPDLCLQPRSYWNDVTMGFGELISTPAECAVKIPDDMSFESASLAEPTGVALDVLKTAQIEPGDRVLLVGPGPIGLAAACIAHHMGAAWVGVAGRSRAKARMNAAKKLGADFVIEVDKCPISEYDFGEEKPNKILITSPPKTITEAVQVADRGGTLVYIGMAYGVDDEVKFEADYFHTSKLQLKASFASPALYLRDSVRCLQIFPEIGRYLVGPTFPLEDIANAFASIRDDHGKTVLKPIMVNK